MKGDAARLGYTQTLFGRRRYFEGIHSPISYVRASAERMAVNAPMQGTQADIIKLAMIEVDSWIEKEHVREDVYLLLTVHDELVFEVSEEKIKECAAAFKKIMEGVVPKEKLEGVPIIVEGKVGANWGQMQPLKS